MAWNNTDHSNIRIFLDQPALQHCRHLQLTEPELFTEGVITLDKKEMNSVRGKRYIIQGVFPCQYYR